MAKDNLSELEAKQKEWEDGNLKKYLEEYPEREVYTELPVKTVYTPLDKPDSEYLKDLGLPGEYPYTRGITPSMYRSKIWAMAEYSGFGSPEESQKRHKYLIEHGGAQISVAPDLPTQLGYDADDPVAEAEVGLVGTSISSLKDIEDMLDGIPVDKVGIRGSISSLALVLWAMYIVTAEKRGIPVDKLSGDVTFDTMHEYFCRGNYIFPPEHSVRLGLDLVEYGLEHIPKLTYQVNPYVVHEQGATVVQEGAYALATALFYLEAARGRGTINVGDFSAHISQHTASHTHIFEEVAKSRAMRRLWAKLIKERFNPENQEALRCIIDPNTGGSVLTAQQAENNIVRIALEILGAALGGATYIAPCSFDEALAIPTKKAVTMSLRAQQIIAYESGVCDTVDPLGGSYYVEALTDEAEARILDYIKQIESRGGMMGVIKSGWIKQEVARSAYLKQRAIEEGKQVKVGMNKFCVDEEPTFELHKPDPNLVGRRKESLKKLRAERDNSAVQLSLEKLRKAAQGNKNLIPFAIDAVRNYATLGEITSVFKDVFGEYKPVSF
jgi:methylmalonyl-CoA mutase N-terminal domain/subunit